MKVSQLLCAAGPVDAVTNQAFAWRRWFERWGWEGRDYAAHMAPGLPARALRPMRELEGDQEPDVLVLHYSGYVAGLEQVLGRFPRSLLVSHNVTPARFFWAHEPVDAARCELARDQLPALGALAGAVAGVSRFNARELTELSGREADVIPVLFDESRLAARNGEPQGAPTVLFVGRLTPHKRQDLLIRALAPLREAMPEARLVLVGTPLSPPFEERLRALAGRLAPGAVAFETGGISSERLAGHYRSAHVFLCLSEHEGFCIPLLEAFHFGLPVIAREAGAVGEVVDDAGILLGPEDGVDTVAELLRIVISDRELRDELRARGDRRLRGYDQSSTAAGMRGVLETLAVR